MKIAELYERLKDYEYRLLDVAFAQLEYQKASNTKDNLAQLNEKIGYLQHLADELGKESV